MSIVHVIMAIHSQWNVQIDNAASDVGVGAVRHMASIDASRSDAHAGIDGTTMYIIHDVTMAIALIVRALGCAHTSNPQT